MCSERIKSVATVTDSQNDSSFSIQTVILHLLDIKLMMGVLEGVVMEIEDTSLPLVKGKFFWFTAMKETRRNRDLGVIPTDSEETAFKDVDVALFVGAMPRKEGMERKDLLR